MTSLKRRPLEPYELEDIERLKAILSELQRKDSSLTQEKLAQLCGWNSQGNVQNYLGGRTALNLEAAYRFSKALGVSLDEISPTLAVKATQLFEITAAALSEKGIRGTREEIQKSLADQNLLKLFHALPKREQEKFMRDLKVKVNYYEQVFAELLAAKNKTG